MAIEDAWVLAQQLLTTADIQTALRSYEAVRKPRSTKLQNISRSNARLFHESGAANLFIRKIKLGFAQHIPALQHMKLDPIYGVNVVKNYPL